MSCIQLEKRSVQGAVLDADTKVQHINALCLLNQIWPCTDQHHRDSTLKDLIKLRVLQARSTSLCSWKALWFLQQISVSIAIPRIPLTMRKEINCCYKWASLYCPHQPCRWNFPRRWGLSTYLLLKHIELAERTGGSRDCTCKMPY